MYLRVVSLCGIVCVVLSGSVTVVVDGVCAVTVKLVPAGKSLNWCRPKALLSLDASPPQWKGVVGG
jgi:hypothetical protein